jgi:hypothetical protein
MRAAYVGDNSRVMALVRALFPDPPFTYTLSLQTSAPPFALTVKIDESAKPTSHTDFSEQATLLLGLIGNVDAVAVTSGGTRYSLTAADASKRLRYDVKELGKSKAVLAQYLHAIESD